MSKHTNKEVLIAYLICLIWNMFVMGGCSYIVFGLHHSGFWFILALLMIISPKGDDDMEKEL